MTSVWQRGDCVFEPVCACAARVWSGSECWRESECTCVQSARGVCESQRGSALIFKVRCTSCCCMRCSEEGLRVKSFLRVEKVSHFEEILPPEARRDFHTEEQRPDNSGGSFTQHRRRRKSTNTALVFEYITFHPCSCSVMHIPRLKANFSPTSPAHHGATLCLRFNVTRPELFGELLPQQH